MSSIELLPELGPLTPADASAWVAASLAEAAALRCYDRRLFPASDELLDDARKVHQLWQRWLSQAQQLMEQLSVLGEQTAQVRGLQELDREVARVRAMLQIAPERHLLALQQANREATVSGEEVRREVDQRRAKEQGRHSGK
jgi:hypothetical protein